MCGTESYRVFKDHGRAAGNRNLQSVFKNSALEACIADFEFRCAFIRIEAEDPAGNGIGAAAICKSNSNAR